jgi:hypothetical protein
MRRIAFAACVAIATTAAPSPSFADPTIDATVSQCVDANTKAQILRRAGQLAAARQELSMCGDPRCPRMVRSDCAQRLDELNRAQPTIVFDAKDTAGADVVAVVVTIDGRPFTDRLDGSPIEVDPGPHTFMFIVAGQAPVTRSLVVKEGARGRLERVVLAPAPASAPGTFGSPAEAPRTGQTSERARGLGREQIAGIALAGIGVGGVVLGATYGLLAKSAWDDAKARCNAASCPESSRGQAVSQRSTAVTDGTVSTVGFIAGGILLAGGIALAIVAPRVRERSVGEPTALRLSPAVGPATVGLDLRGEF